MITVRDGKERWPGITRRRQLPKMDESLYSVSAMVSLLRRPDNDGKTGGGGDGCSSRDAWLQPRDGMASRDGKTVISAYMGSYLNAYIFERGKELSGSKVALGGILHT
eukprot:scaffold3247_cov44-Cyclotella_meneghiniana.AAC.1